MEDDLYFFKERWPDFLKLEDDLKKIKAAKNK